MHDREVLRVVVGRILTNMKMDGIGSGSSREERRDVKENFGGPTNQTKRHPQPTNKQLKSEIMS
jgi:hypothetical protein